jgi:8-oxo-dGTP pyrophosphatase MutT (NUDIX family)
MTQFRADLDAFVAQTSDEARDVVRIRALLDSADPWDRSTRLHVTGSAIVVHPPSRRVLLRWHEHMQRWLQVGGHADAGEIDPFATAVREAQEETGLLKLQSWPDPAHRILLHVVIVPVPAGRGEPAHEHADVRYLLATDEPDAIAPEDSVAQLRWLSLRDAMSLTADDNVHTTLERVAALFAKYASNGP